MATKETEAALLNLREVAATLGCSPRHVERLADRGDMPRPVRLGALVRWSSMEIRDWIARGCPPERRQHNE